MSKLNINWGTEFDDGLRSGPSWPDLGLYKNFGPGMLHAPLAGINMIAKAGGGIYKPAAAQTDLKGFSWAKKLTSTLESNTLKAIPLGVGASGLQQDTSFQISTPLSTNHMPGMKPRTVLGLTLDHPRTLVYSLDQATAGVDMFTLGYDLYGQPTMEQVTFSSTKAVLYGRKAFAEVLGVFVGCPSGVTLDTDSIVGVSVGNAFGFPYFMYGAGDIAYSYEGLPVPAKCAIMLGQRSPETPITSVDLGCALTDPRGVFSVVDPNVTGNIMLSGAYSCLGFDAQIQQQAAMGVSGGVWEIEGKDVTLPMQPLRPYLPLSVYTNPAYPFFDAVVVADSPSGFGSVKTGPSGIAPVLPNQIFAYGMEQYWNAGFAQTLDSVW